MAKIEMVNDVMVPLGVTAANIAARAYDIRQKKNGVMAYQPLVAMAGVAVGYALQLTSKNPEKAKTGNRIAVASFPTMGVAIYDWIVAATAGTTTSRTQARTITVQGDPLLGYKKGGI